MENNQNDNLMTFGEHLEVFRKMLFRIIGITVCLAVIIFCAKDVTFRLLLSPSDNHFITYRLIEECFARFGMDFHFDSYSIQLINTELASQFMVHMSTSVYLALLLVSPYIMIELYRYIAPALYENERRYSVSVAIAIYLLFILGVLAVCTASAHPSRTLFRSVNELFYIVSILFALFGDVSSGDECGESNQFRFVHFYLCYFDIDDGIGIPTACLVFLLS